jgi:hypothetical protein
MPNNPYPSDECENICDKLSRWELGKKNFKVLQTDLVYNSVNNTYTGTYMNVEISGEIFLVETDNILISPNTNTLLLNIAYDGTEIVPSITSEQKTVSEASELMTSNTYTNAGSTCSFNLPIQLDGRDTNGGSDCSKLSEFYSVTPRMIQSPNMSYNLNTVQTTISGSFQFNALGESYKKILQQQTFSGNSTIIRIYGNANNFEIIEANATSPKDLKAQCEALNTECTFHYPFSTFGRPAFYTTYTIDLTWAESINVYDWQGSGVQVNGIVQTRNQPGVNGWVRAGFKDENMVKVFMDTRLNAYTNNNVHFVIFQDSVVDGNFVGGGDPFWYGADFSARLGTGLNQMGYEVNQTVADANNRNNFQSARISSSTLNNKVGKSFYIKNNISPGSFVGVSFSTDTPVLTWLNFD